MKTVLIIGMGRFGHHLASNMISLGNEVMIVDKDESRLEDLTKLISIFVLFVLEQISKVVWKLQVCSKN